MAKRAISQSLVLLNIKSPAANCTCRLHYGLLYQLVHPDTLPTTSLGLAHHLLGISTDRLRDTDACDEVDRQPQELAKTAFLKLGLPANGLPSKDTTAAKRQSLAKCLLVALLDCQDTEDYISALVGETTAAQPVL